MIFLYLSTLYIGAIIYLIADKYFEYKKKKKRRTSNDK